MHPSFSSPSLHLKELSMTELMPISPLIYTQRLISDSALENDPTPQDCPRGTKVIAWKNTVSQGAEILKFVLFFCFLSSDCSEVS